ncbi:hypothetical protein A0J57_20110 [Sphingobium sp. 22B]|uniref:hypothetical protein n=1 Tax=unclassified Sphingobium TaxID=2611147 RepID=UPI0007838FC3|nr:MULTISPECIES: hypothetical protein [unclassified Sphingobium]KXU30651.1 hypothetical protein AXW74_16700 [Sphingobium sp. AM]KYC30544.1 hypothetical protein A0J57_20110 [Sphingobium sp. 22B]OAP30265.1 hypothetical protein A8O16_19415 [Sphingobium sp. 20006FA]
MATLASKSFLLSQKPRSTELFVPEWDATVRLEQFNVERRVAFMTTLQDNAKAVADYNKDPDKMPKVEPLDEALVGIVFSVVDENGDLMFTIDDIPELKKLPYAQVQQIYLHMLSMAYSGAITKDIDAEKKG